MALRIASWNINSVRLRIGLVERFLAEHKPDILCLQEIKCANEVFPLEAVKAAGYGHVAVHGQPGYHGVAIVARVPIEELARQDFNGTTECRHVAIRLKRKKGADVVVHSLYVPSGGDVPDPDANPKFRQKLDFLSGLSRWAGGKRAAGEAHIALGDLNVAPLEHDVWSHKQMLDVVSHTPVEVEAFEKARKAGGWVDVMRAHVPASEKLYTWWSYRAKDWRASNRGRRLDHIWATEVAAAKAKSMQVVDTARDWTQPSDHVPVLADFDL